MHANILNKSLRKYCAILIVLLCTVAPAQSIDRKVRGKIVGIDRVNRFVLIQNKALKTESGENILVRIPFSRIRTVKVSKRLSHVIKEQLKAKSTVGVFTSVGTMVAVTVAKANTIPVAGQIATPFIVMAVPVAVVGWIGIKYIFGKNLRKVWDRERNSQELLIPILSLVEIYGKTYREKVEISFGNSYE